VNNNPFESYVIDTEKFLTRSQQEAFARMKMVLEQSGLGILTGEIGSGKSTILRHIAQIAPAEKFHFIYLCISKLKTRELYSELLNQLGETPPYGLLNMKRMFAEVIQQQIKQSDKKPLIVIDEAQDIHSEALLELRFIMNFDMDLAPIFSVILAGQPELRKILRLRKFEPILQRTKMQYHLVGLSKEEIGEYIKVRLAKQGLTKPVFAESAISKIFAASNGIPRIINTICMGAFFDAQLKDEDVIEERHVHRAIFDLEHQRGQST
jgi:type II secretory pathway predicted ATPase ExeA